MLSLYNILLTILLAFMPMMPDSQIKYDTRRLINSIDSVLIQADENGLYNYDYIVDKFEVGA